jgi:hypothetical protein
MNCTVRGRDCNIWNEQRAQEMIACRALCLSRRACDAAGEVVLVQRVTNEGLDEGLPADIQFRRGIVEFTQHRRSKVDIHSLHGGLPWPHHATFSRKRPGNVLAFVGALRDLFGCDCARAMMRFLHQVSVPPLSPSKASPDGSFRPLHLRELRRGGINVRVPPIRSRGIARADRSDLLRLFKANATFGILPQLLALAPIERESH